MRSLTGFLKGQFQPLAKAWILWRLSHGHPQLSLQRANWAESLRNPSQFYLECVRFFQQKLPGELKDHRAWFHNVPEDRRGYGEDAFHVMWFLLFQEFRPADFMEIGVFRGQTLSLAALLPRVQTAPSCQVYGISPFTPAGDSVSTYRSDIDYYEDTLRNFEHFHLPPPHLVRAYSTDAAALELIGSKAWSMIYIDGNHDYEIARQDWENCSRNLKPGGIIVLDDAGLTTEYHPPIFASRGHPGPSRVAQEIDRGKFRELLQVGHNRVFQKV
jgi:hypothetical protein